MQLNEDPREPRSRYITIKDIAASLGISKSTVSRALSGEAHNVCPETRRKVEAEAIRLGYRRNELAANLRSQSNHVVGIVVPEVLTPFSMSFITEVQKILLGAGYGVTIAVSDESPEIERANLEMLNRQRVDGILISTCHTSANRDVYENFLQRRIPLVFFDRTVPELNVSCVCSNDYLKSFFLVEDLIYAGCRRILHLEGPVHLQNSSERRKGWREALEKFRIDLGEEYSIPCGVGIDDGASAVERVMNEGPEFDSIFCFTETQALGAKRALQKLGCRIPEDVAICCMSGTVLSTLVYPQLTAAEQPVGEMAAIAADLLLEKIHDFSAPARSIVVDARIQRRGSTTSKN